MDAEGLHINIEYLSNSGVVLSPEQKAALQISLPILQSDHKLQRVKLWGKIQGIKADYFVAHGVGVDELNDRKAVYRCGIIDKGFIGYSVSTIAKIVFCGCCCRLLLKR